MVIKLLSLYIKAKEQDTKRQLLELQTKHMDKMNLIKQEQEAEKLKHLQLRNIAKAKTIKLQEGTTYVKDNTYRDILTIEIFKNGLNVIFREWDYKRDTQAQFKAQEFNTQEEAINFFGKKTKG